MSEDGTCGLFLKIPNDLKTLSRHPIIICPIQPLNYEGWVLSDFDLWRYNKLCSPFNCQDIIGMTRLSYWLQSEFSIIGFKINDRFNYYFIVTHHRFYVFSLYDSTSLGVGNSFRYFVENICHIPFIDERLVNWFFHLSLANVFTREGPIRTVQSL